MLHVRNQRPLRQSSRAQVRLNKFGSQHLAMAVGLACAFVLFGLLRLVADGPGPCTRTFWTFWPMCCNRWRWWRWMCCSSLQDPGGIHRKRRLGLALALCSCGGGGKLLSRFARKVASDFVGGCRFGCASSYQGTANVSVGLH
jgi:hypothetical protein